MIFKRNDEKELVLESSGESAIHYCDEKELEIFLKNCARRERGLLFILEETRHLDTPPLHYALVDQYSTSVGDHLNHQMLGGEFRTQFILWIKSTNFEMIG